MKRSFLLVILLSACFVSFSQDGKPGTTPPKTNPGGPKDGQSKIKPYKDVITEKAKTSVGLFTVHKVDDRYFFEIPDSLFEREWMSVVRAIGLPTNAGYGGQEINRKTLRWEKAPDNKILLRMVSYINVASDSLPINEAVKVSNTEPIVASFDVAAFSKDSAGVVIDVTDFFKGDNPAVSLSLSYKKSLGLSGLAPDRSFINSIRSYPINTEVRTTKTFIAGGPVTYVIIGDPAPRGLPTGDNAGVVTMEINTSMILLPKEPMKRRFFDPRIGYFSNTYNNYGLDEQKVTADQFIVRWRLEPKPEDVEKMKRGELVEPQKPIVYYIDPATPVKWRKYLKQGVENWQKSFEKAGFKNAIIAKDWPVNDSTMSLEDARFSVIRYFASDIENAFGPNVSDPRSGEILESHLGWYHNVMKLLHDWYFAQAGAIDPAAQSWKFSDELMGELIRIVCSHEVGHTLGLMHNFGSSSSVPVEKLRDKNFVEANGHTPSIMDYARFNYVAQPEDHITLSGILPRIGDYDDWAIQWGYKTYYNKTEYEEKDILNTMATAALKNPRLVFLRQRFDFPDPRAQNEDLGDDAVKASEYGLKNLKRLLPNLQKWAYRPGEGYDELQDMYQAVQNQFLLYTRHVTNNIGGIYENNKLADEGGNIFVPVPKSMQKRAVEFLLKNVFETPQWLLDWRQLKLFNQDQVVEDLRIFQQGRLNYLLNANRFARMIENTAQDSLSYSIDQLMEDVRTGIFSEMYKRQPIDLYRRNLQKVFTDRLIDMANNVPAVNNSLTFPPLTPYPRRVSSGLGLTPVDPLKDDISSVVKANLVQLKADIKSALPFEKDKMTRYHLQDLQDRIEKALNPK